MRSATLAAVLLVVAVAGCAQDARPAGPDLPPEASAEQTAAMEDGRVTEEEYSSGYRRFVACLKDEGFEVIELGRPSTVYDFAVPETAHDSGAFDLCYNREFFIIDMTWQTDNPPTTEVAQKLAECLEEAGLPTEGNDEELKQRMIDNGLDVLECLGV